MTTKKLSTSSLRNIRDLSKGDTIEFLRKHVNPNLKCIEDLGTGVDFCLAMNRLVPNSCDVHKVKKGSDLSEYDIRTNFNLLREAFKISGVDKNFPSESMMKKNFQSNFYFAQWFVRFFEANQKRAEKEKANAKIKGTVRLRKNIQGGARSVPKETATSRSPTSDDRSSGILTPTAAFSKIVNKRQMLSKSLIYGKFNNALPAEVISKEGSSQTEEKTTINVEDKVEGLMDVQQQLQRISMEQMECIEKLQKENDALSESLEHSNLQKSYFHKKLDQVEEMCDDCSSDALRSSLRRVLYEEGLPM